MTEHQKLSFFDGYSASSLYLWQKNFHEQSFERSGETPLFEGYLIKRGRRLVKIWLQRYYVLYKNTLIYYQTHNQECIKGIMDLSGVRLEKRQDPKTKFDGIGLMKNGQTVDLFCKDKNKHAQLYENLRKICINSNFHEQYEVIKMIGKGGFAKVYLAERKSDQQMFAIKALSKDKMATQPNAREALLNEIYVTRYLNHENVIKIYEVYESQTSVYIVLELLKGGELLNIIESKQVITEGQIKLIIKKLINILVYFDEMNIMHRDLKPDNLILISKDNSELFDFKVVDFGLATFVNTKKHIYKKCGTPGFVAPEVFTTSDGKYTNKCDVFSAGCILHQLFTGTVPFDTTTKNILEANRKGMVKINQDSLKKVSKNAQNLITDMLKINPQQRPSAKQLLTHPFFTVNDPENDQCQILVKPENQRNFQAQLKKIRKQLNVTAVPTSQTKGNDGLQPIDAESHFEIRLPAINGHTSTIVDSRRGSLAPDSPNLLALQARQSHAQNSMKTGPDECVSPHIQQSILNNRNLQQTKNKMNAVNGASDIYKYTLMKKTQQMDKNQMQQQSPKETNFKDVYESVLAKSENQPRKFTQQYSSDDNNKSLMDFENIHLTYSEESPLSVSVKILNQTNLIKLSTFNLSRNLTNSKNILGNKDFSHHIQTEPIQTKSTSIFEKEIYNHHSSKNTKEQAVRSTLKNEI